MAVNNENTMFMRWDGDDFILHGTFVDDFATIPTSDKLKEEFKRLYSADFEVTGGGLMESFRGPGGRAIRGENRFASGHIYQGVNRIISAISQEVHKTEEGSYGPRTYARERRLPDDT